MISCKYFKYFYLILVIFICRRGNDSQKALKTIKGLLRDETKVMKDVIGGLHDWTRKIDPTFPIY